MKDLQMEMLMFHILYNIIAQKSKCKMILSYEKTLNIFSIHSVIQFNISALFLKIK